MGEASGTEYADHEVQVIHGRAQTFPLDNDEEIDEVLEFEPVSDRGLDSDELAELVAFYRTVTIQLQNEQSTTQTQIGQGQLEYGLGINLSESEFAEQSGEAHGGQRLDDVDGVLVKNNYAEPGVLDSINDLEANSGAAPATDSTISVGPNGGEFTRFMNFPRNFGSGPYVDRTDDLTMHIEAANKNFNGDVQVFVSVILYWDVKEMPEGRASFARP